MERCEDRRMLSGDAFVDTIDLFGDSLTDTTNGGFFYRLDQDGEVGFVSDPLSGAQWHLFADGQYVSGNATNLDDSAFTPLPSTDIVSQPNSPAFIEDVSYLSTWSSWRSFVVGSVDDEVDFSGVIVLNSDSGFDLTHEDLEKFLPKPEIGRIPLVPPTIVEQGNASESVISLAGLFDANQRTHDTELLAIRSALLASHLDQPLPLEADGAQPANPVVLQEAESDSTWDRAWSFELASFSPRTPLENPNGVSETTSTPKSVTPNTTENMPLSMEPLSDSPDSPLNDGEESSAENERLVKSTDIRAEALAELDQVTLSSSAWGLAVDRRGGLLISVVAILAAQRVWNVSSVSPLEEKEEPRRKGEKI